jgi:Ca2+-binding RTX toxin-like protein
VPYFVFSDGPDTFAVEITDPAQVQHARGLIDGSVTDSAHIGGTVRAGSADSNIGWSYHIAPQDVRFYDMSAEIGDAPIADVEEFVNSRRSLEEFLPHNFWASWATFVVRELREISGTTASDMLSGTRSADIIFGRGGNDSLQGWAGDDFLVGGSGEDWLDGGYGDDKLGGGGGNDILQGASGKDVLDGGSGADRMYGGLGNDIFIVDSALDLTMEFADGGIDLVKSSVSLTLRSNIEQLKLMGAADINGKGNVGANVLIGNSGDNRLWGLDGNDILYSDGGDDRIASGNDHLYGGAGDDRLYGGEGNDRLDGGTGVDRMHGGLGDDVYVVNDTTDYAYELAQEGTDRVNSSITYTLRANIENLTLTGSNAIDGIGNGLNNVLTGNTAANVLSGGDGADLLQGAGGNDTLNGGTGNDRLVGGAGTDKFLFDTRLNANANVDKIVDFSAADDSLVLDQTIFSALAITGILASSEFRTGTAAQDADDRIIFDGASGRIYYDADGNGAGAQVLLATVTAGIALTDANFLVIG